MKINAFSWDKKTRLLVAAGVLVVAALIAMVVLVKGKNKEEPVHYHAGFQVYVDNKLQDFSDLRYMNVEPCGGLFHSEDNQIEKAHLHDSIGDVVHVHRKNAVWSDLFINIDFAVPTSSEFVGYLNGERREDILNYPILPYDSVVFFSGPIQDMNRKLQARVTDDHIKEVEAKSENCGANKK